MEKEFLLELDELMNRADVTGVICCDLHGLPLAVRGVANEAQSGAVSSIAQQAAKVFPSESESPTICLESDGSNLLIRRQDKVVVGIFKHKN